MTKPKYLYHGTNGAAARDAIVNGLSGRGGKGNWSHSVESHPDCVYLTDAYPAYFALNAVLKLGALLHDSTNDKARKRIMERELGTRTIVPNPKGE